MDYENYLADVWDRYIESKLPQIDNVQYKVSMSTNYNCAKKEHEINCNCKVLKNIYTSVTIPIEDASTKGISDYMNLLIENLINEINGVKHKPESIELNGIRYYPRNEE